MTTDSLVSEFGGGWNHRVVRSVDPTGEEFFEVAEVYYNKKREPVAYCNAKVCGETLDIAREELARFAKALEQPVLNATDFPAGGNP